MRYFKISVMIIIAYIIQIGVLSKLRIFGVVPDFVVAMLICFSLKEENFLTAGIFGAVFGLLLDTSRPEQLWGFTGFYACICQNCAAFWEQNF